MFLPSVAMPLGRLSLDANVTGPPPHPATGQARSLPSVVVKYTFWPSTAIPYGEARSCAIGAGWHTPASHLPPKQPCPHLPQWSPSLCVSAQTSPHAVCCASHTSGSSVTVPQATSNAAPRDKTSALMRDSVRGRLLEPAPKWAAAQGRACGSGSPVTLRTV